MSLPEKTINQIAQTTDIAADDILIVEKSSGTKIIKYSDLMNAVKVSLGIVDTLEITEKGYITAWKKSDNQRYKEMKNKTESVK